MSAEAAATGHGGKTAGEYIIHHLQHLQVGHGFWTFNVDSIVYAALLGAGDLLADFLDLDGKCDVGAC